MNATLKSTISLLVLLISLCISGQEYTEEVPDSLLQKDYKALYDLYYEERDRDNNKGSLIYARAYLAKAKAEKDSGRIGRAFKYFAFASIDTLAYRYGDSIIHYTKNSTDKYYPTQGYIIKGTRLYNWGEYDKSLDNFLTAYTYAKEKENTVQLMEIRYAIGAIKNRWGSYEEALVIFKENLADIQQQEDYKTKYQTDYFIALRSLYNCYINNNKVDSAKFYVKKGIEESLALQDSIWYYKFVLSSGVTHYYDKNYAAAIDSITKGIPHLNAITSMIGYFYKGKSFYELQQQDSAIIYFKKADTLFGKTRDEFPELREMYQTLVDYYKEKGDIENQLTYIDKLLYVDSLLVHNYKYLNENITQKYDIPYATAQKEAIIKKLNEDKSVLNRNIILIVIASLLLIVGIFIYHLNRRKVYKKRFELLLQEKNVDTPKRQLKKEIKDIDIAEDKINHILKGLKKVEEKEMYLNPDIKIGDVAKFLKTNTKYVSTVINFYEKKSFVRYINDLRIDYIVEKLKTESLFRRYSIKAISKEAGFNSREPFTKAFRRRTGILPYYFVEELKKRNNETT